jgi:hypothetical protein
MNMIERQAVHPFWCHVPWKCVLFCCFFVFLAGCVSGSLTRARSDFFSGRADEAAKVLADPDEVSGRDRLLYFMDKGLILHHLGRYEESIQTLLGATWLMEEQDRISMGEQAASLVTTEWVTEYKGEYAERLMVHTYLMMNYLITGHYEDALVEGKQALKVFDRHPDACRNDYFTRALIAQCFEIVGDINGAYIEYKKLANAMPDPSPVAARVYSLGMQLGFDDEVESYRQYVPEAEPNGAGGQKSAELVLFVSQGLSPVKIPQNIVLPPSIRFSFSTYLDRSHYYHPPEIIMASGSGEVRMVTSDVGQVLKDSLQDRLAQILIKETARAAAKEAIAQSVKDDDAELLVRIVLFLLEQPDTRCWETLPGYLTLVRIPVSPGQHQLTVNTFDGPGGSVTIPDININSGPQFYFYSVFSGSITTTAAD